MPKQILFISRNLPPLIGGIERLAHRLHDGLTQQHQITLIGPKGCSKYVHPNVRTIELPVQPIAFILLSSVCALWLSFKTSFDICIGANGLMAPACFLIKLTAKVPSIILVHGLDLTARNKLYQLIFIPLIGKADRIIANSTSTKKIALRKHLAESKISIINPGVDLPNLVDDSPPPPFPGNTNPKIILFVGRILRRKGLSSFIHNCLSTIVAHYRGNCKLVVVGDSPKDAVVKDINEANAVNAAIQQQHLKEHVEFLGKISDAQLNQIYQQADILILPVIEIPGDIEGFGMVILEAASFGVPAVAFNIGGVSDAITTKTGLLVSKNDYEALSKATIYIIDNKQSYIAECKQRAYICRWESYITLVNQEIEELTDS